MHDLSRFLMRCKRDAEKQPVLRLFYFEMIWHGQVGIVEATDSRTRPAIVRPRHQIAGVLQYTPSDVQRHDAGR